MKSRAQTPWLRTCALICALTFSGVAPAPQVLAQAQTSDLNAPYEDAYDVQTRGKLVGTWSGTISGSSISQGDGQMSGQAVFVERGYKGRNTFAIALHDHRHRKVLEYSEVRIGNIPCGPDGGAIRAAHPIELQGGAVGPYATTGFYNTLADTRRDDFSVYRDYGATLDNPANLRTRWTDDTFSLKLSGTFIAGVAPTRNNTFDYERQREGWVDKLNLDVEFTLENGPETRAAFSSTLCEEPEFFEVVNTEPLTGRENVILEGADFFVQFSRDVDEGSLDPSTVTMTTRDANNGFVFVDLDLRLEDPSGLPNEKSLRIEPREPLRSGTIYEIFVTGGEDGVRGRARELLEEDHTISISTMVAPDEMRFGVYQVTRNAPLVHGKPAAARIQYDWEALEDIHPDWQVLDYALLAEVRDDRDKTVFPELQRRLERTDQFNDEDRRLGLHTLNLFEWTPSGQNAPRNVQAEVRPENHYPDDVDIAPVTVELTLDYASQHVDQVTFDYYIAEHSEWQEGADPQILGQILQAARQEQAFANQILPVARVRGRYKGSYNLQDTICGLPGAGWALCDEDGFSLWSNLGQANPAKQAAVYNNWNALVRLFHEHVAAQSNADILVSYHPPSLGGGGITRGEFEQSESLRRPGDEPHWFGEPDAGPMDSLHTDRTGQNMIIMSAFSPAFAKNRPGVLYSPLVAHEFGHVYGLPHTPYANDAQHRHEICQKQFQTVAPGIDGMRIALDGADGWQKSSDLGNAQTSAPMLNLMFPCLYEPHRDYWIDGNQYNWLIERMPAMLRYSRGRRAEAPVYSRVQLAQLSDAFDDDTVRNDGTPALPDARWIMLSGVVEGANAMLLPAIGVRGQRDPLAGDGPYELHVEGADGHLLASASIGPRPAETGPWPFAVTVPVSGEPARIVLRREAQVIAERRADPALGAPEVTSHAPGANYRAGEALTWDQGQAGGLTYSLRYTVDGQHWSTLAVLLNEPQFTPDPATLMAGPATAFEIIARDGVTERVTRLPVTLDVPLEPLGVWADEQTGGARVAFNIPVEESTLGGIMLETGGRGAPVNVTLDPSGMTLNIAPQGGGEGGDYTLTVPTTLRAEDGRSLGQQVSFTFSPPPASAPGSASASANPDDQSAPEPVGTGEITLQLGDALTLPARVLGCEAEADGPPQRLLMDFETTPGDWVKVSMTRDGDTALAVEMTLGNGVVLKGPATIEDGWSPGSEGQALTAHGHVGEAATLIEYSFTGQCPPM
ncbi:Ig-like domain-containing protein [Oceanibium sediminis]|uniref:Ig-like domain-containing protein n=1 Tax=Oceanibium sediminis TaxID=2026339 RepID=UPI0013005D65|nr:hypothetical protein [Oceanibium sediminis]